MAVPQARRWSGARGSTGLGSLAGAAPPCPPGTHTDVPGGLQTWHTHTRRSPERILGLVLGFGAVGFFFFSHFFGLFFFWSPGSLRLRFGGTLKDFFFYRDFFFFFPFGASHIKTCEKCKYRTST